MTRPIASLLRDSRASAAAEMALILPAVVFIFLNVADLSVYLYSKMQVDIAAQSAVGAARVLCDTDTKLPATTKCATLTTTMQGAAQTTSLGTNVALGTPNEAYYCATASGALTQVAAVGATVPADCSATVSGSTARPGNYISVTATYPFTPIFPGATVASVLTSPITRTAWIRLK